MEHETANIKGPLASRATCVAELEEMSLDELVDYVLRRFVDDYDASDTSDEDEDEDEEYDEGPEDKQEDSL